MKNGIVQSCIGSAPLSASFSIRLSRIGSIVCTANYDEAEERRARARPLTRKSGGENEPKCFSIDNGRKRELPLTWGAQLLYTTLLRELRLPGSFPSFRTQCRPSIYSIIVVSNRLSPGNMAISQSTTVWQGSEGGSGKLLASMSPLLRSRILRTYRA
jgi:hypothetical protein